MNRNLKKTLIGIIGIMIVLISGYVVFYVDDNLGQSLGATNTIPAKKTTDLSAELFPQLEMSSLDDLSLRGYLMSDNSGLSNQTVRITVAGIHAENNAQTSEKSLVLGDSRTDQNGCFYFNTWNNAKLENESKQLSGTSEIFIKTSFNGDNQFSSSSNVTKLEYSSIFAPELHIPISANLMDGTDIVQSITLKRNTTHDYNIMISKLGLLTTTNEQILDLGIKGLPCGIMTTIDNEKADLSNNDVATASLQISANKNSIPGRYDIFLVGNSYILEQLKLTIE